MGILDAPFISRETIGARLRRLAEHGRSTDPFRQPVLTALPAWAPSTAYLVGKMVSNGGNAYICFGAGTSAASGGPSTTTAATITDGGTLWVWVGPIAPVVAAGDVRIPVYTTSGSVPGSPLTNVFTPGTAQSYFKVFGATPTNAGGNMNLFRFNQNATPTAATGDARVAFWTDAPKFVIDAATNSLLRIRIDGQFYSQGNLEPSAAVQFHIFDFTSSGGRKPRLIELEYNRNTFYFRGFRCTSSDQVWAANETDALRSVWIGDSLWAGSGYAPFTQTVPHIAGPKLGWKDPWNLSIGGTGWCNPGGSNYTYGGRVPQALALNPDIWLFGTAVNDLSYTSAQVTAAVTAALQAVRAGGSRAPIVVFGVWSPDYSTTRTQAQLLAAEQAVQAGVAAFADPLNRTFFIPIVQDPVLPWITTANNNGGRTTSNNVATIITNDNLHPGEYGVLYFAERCATAVRNQVVPALA